MQPAYDPHFKPRAHQKKATTLMLESTFANFDEQGLGKTKQAYDLVAKLISSGEINFGICVVKSRLKENICREICRDAYQLSPVIIKGNLANRMKTYKYLSGNVLIVSYDTVVRDRDVLVDLVKCNQTIVCFDESHYLKNMKAQRTIGSVEISKHAKKALIFSGTPIPNRSEDIFPQLKILGFEVGGSLKEFKAKYPSAESVRGLLAGKFIRRKKEDLPSLKIPPKRIRRIEIGLSTIQQQLYDKLRDELRMSLRELGVKQKFLPISNVCTKLLRLLQISSNPALIYDGYKELPGKIKALQQLVSEGNKNSKVIVWTSFRGNVSFLSNALKEYGAVTLHGGLKRQEREDNVQKFMTQDNCRVMIATPQCAREGFTLTSASTAVYLDRSFSYLDWSQSQDRIHRISQLKPCDVVILESKNTIDQYIETILSRKSKLQAYLLEEDASSEDPTQMSVEEVISILECK